MARGYKPETKYCGERVVDANFNNQITSADVYPVCPAISQGTGDYQRLGTKLRGKSLIIRGTVTLNDDMNSASGYTTQSNGPIIVRVMVLANKSVKAYTGSFSTAVSTGSLIDDRIGNGTTRPFLGNNYDVYAPLNKDLFTVYMDRKVKLIPQNAAGAGTYPYMGQRTYSFTCRVPAPSSMSFDDTSTGSYPTNFAPFLTAAWAYANDKIAGTADQIPVHIQAISTLYFTDA